MKRIIIGVLTLLFACTAYATGIQYCYTLAGTWTGTAINTLGDSIVLSQTGTTVSGTWTQHGSGCSWVVGGSFVSGSTTLSFSAPAPSTCGPHGGQPIVIQLGTPGCQSAQVSTGYHATVIMTQSCTVPTTESSVVSDTSVRAQATFKSTLGNGSYNYGGRSIQSVPGVPVGGTCSAPPLAAPATQYLFVDSTNSYSEISAFDPNSYMGNLWGGDLPCTGTYTDVLNIDCTDGNRTLNGGGEPEDGGGLVWTPFANPVITTTVRNNAFTTSLDVGRSEIQKETADATHIKVPDTLRSAAVVWGDGINYITQLVLSHFH